jgi:hypothetical protein
MAGLKNMLQAIALIAATNGFIESSVDFLPGAAKATPSVQHCARAAHFSN